MLRLLYTHSRDIYVKVFEKQVLYTIPIHNEKFYPHYKIVKESNHIKLLMSQEPISPHQEVSSYSSFYKPMEIPAESEKSSQSHQLS